jgi:hypothetical protein
MSVLEERYQVDLNEARFADVATVGQLQKLIAEGAVPTTEHIFPSWPQNSLTTAVRLVVYYLLAWPATYLLAAPRIRGGENLRGLHGPILVISNQSPISTSLGSCPRYRPDCETGSPPLWAVRGSQE